MQPINNTSSNVFNNKSSCNLCNNTTEVHIKTIATKPVQETSKFPTENMHSRKINGSVTPSAIRFDFPEYLAKQRFLDISSTVLPMSVVFSWENSEAGCKWQEIAQIVFANTQQQIQNKKSLIDVVNDLNTVGSTKLLYNAFKLLGLEQESEQLLEAAIEQFKITNTPNRTVCSESRIKDISKNITPSKIPSKNTQQYIGEVLKNKNLPLPGSNMYRRLTRLLSIDSALGNNWRGLASKYRMTVDDVQLIEAQAEGEQKCVGEILIGHIIDTQAHKETILLDLYNNLKQLNPSLACELLEWGKSQSIK